MVAPQNGSVLLFHLDRSEHVPHHHGLLSLHLQRDGRSVRGVIEKQRDGRMRVTRASNRESHSKENEMIDEMDETVSSWKDKHKGLITSDKGTAFFALRL